MRNMFYAYVMLFDSVSNIKLPVTLFQEKLVL